MTRHRFLNEGRSPIPMGATAEFACTCGRRGTRAIIERHIAESQTAEDAAPPAPLPPETTARYATRGVESENDFGGDTMAHYLPIEPRSPAPFTDETSAPKLPPPPPPAAPCPICQAGHQIADLPEIAAWSCGHWVSRKPWPIAESFQDMLRTAFQAGVAAASSGETFEIWYQREVLQ